MTVAVRMGNFTLDGADFAAIARMTHAHAGIRLNPGKQQLVYARLVTLVRRLGLEDFPEFVALMQSDAQVRHAAICALTTNHTRLFREDHHYQHFAETARPALVAAAARGRPVRLWSSACASGEEAVSLAMAMLGTDRAEGARLAPHDIAILATDLAPHVLDTARLGSYPADDARDIPDPYRRAWTRIVDDRLTMAPEVRAIVHYRQLNLIDAWPMRSTFDIIFCRNVMIYFDEPTRERLIERFAAVLKPGGYLYLGHSERAVGPAAAAFETVGNTIYRRRAC